MRESSRLTGRLARLLFRLTENSIRADGPGIVPRQQAFGIGMHLSSRLRDAKRIACCRRIPRRGDLDLGTHTIIIVLRYRPNVRARIWDIVHNLIEEGAIL